MSIVKPSYFFKKKRIVYVCALLVCTFFGFMPRFAYALSTGAVISQVYGGGGNAGATYNSDFIELFNRGNSSVSLAGWSVQYAAAGSAAWTAVPLTGTLGVGQYYLIRLGNGGVAGVALPTPDASFITLNINAAVGKVALVNTITPLVVVNPVGLAQVVDFIGYGAAGAFETAAAPAPSNTTSDVRVGLGCYETDNNSVDFLVRTPPLARNTASAPNTCGAAVLLGQYRMDEATWAVGVGSVKDTSGNNRHGDVIATTAPVPASVAPARTGNPGTCGYGTFTTAVNSTGRVSIPNLPVNITMGAQTSVSFWMYWNGVSGTMPIGWQLHDLWYNAGGFGFNTAGSDVYGIASPSLANTWKHVTAIFTNGSRTANSLYIDGIAQPLSVFSGNIIPANAIVGTTLRVGGWGNDNGYKFSGRIDELKVFNGALTPAQVTSLYNETHPCGALLSLQKTVNVLCDPVNGTTDPKNIPGAVVQYIITATNSGSASAILTQLSDPVGVFATFDPNLINGTGGATGCNSLTGTPTSAIGRGFSLDVIGDTRAGAYPKYLTTTNADADGALHNAGNVTVNYGIAMPVESGYAAGEIRPSESAVVKFNAVVN
ncbi:MAG: hypothetical protein HOP06_02155 [Methylotenera sp.]|nr:hypothetical protein [Methylotenera sp.]